MRPDFIESTRLRGPSPACVAAMSLCFLCPTAWAALQAASAQAAPSVVAQTDLSLSNEVIWIKANGLRLKTSIYRSAKLSEHPVRQAMRVLRDIS
jgi:hypothetical protein